MQLQTADNHTQHNNTTILNSIPACNQILTKSTTILITPIPQLPLQLLKLDVPLQSRSFLTIRMSASWPLSIIHRYSLPNGSTKGSQYVFTINTMASYEDSRIPSRLIFCVREHPSCMRRGYHLAKVCQLNSYLIRRKWYQ